MTLDEVLALLARIPEPRWTPRRVRVAPDVWEALRRDVPELPRPPSFLDTPVEVDPELAPGSWKFDPPPPEGAAP